MSVYPSRARVVWISSTLSLTTCRVVWLISSRTVLKAKAFATFRSSITDIGRPSCPAERRIGPGVSAGGAHPRQPLVHVGRVVLRRHGGTPGAGRRDPVCESGAAVTP